MTTYLLLAYFIPFTGSMLIARYINKIDSKYGKENLFSVFFASALPFINIGLLIAFLIIIIDINYGESILRFYSKLNKWFRHEKD